MDSFMCSDRDSDSTIEAKLAVEPSYTDSIVLLPSSSSSSITVSVLFYMIRTIRAFRIRSLVTIIIKMARATTARQLTLAATRNARNSTASVAGASLAPPAPPARPCQSPVANIEAVDTSVEDLTRRRLQNQIDQEAAIASQTLQFAAVAEERRIERETLEYQPRPPPIPGQSLPAIDITSESLVRSPEFIVFSNKFPAVLEKQLVRVFKWPNRDYEASEIYKLLISDAFDAKDDRYDATMIDGSVTY